MIRSDVLLAIFCFGVSFIFTVVAMPGVFSACRKWNLYDLPGGRKVHQSAIPRLGGVLFLPALLLAVAVGLIANDGQSDLVVHPSSLLLACGALLIYLVGLVDDTVGVTARHKFAFQIIASAVLPFCNLYINDLYGLFGLHDIPMWLGYFLTVFWVLLVVNSVNLIDGIDGLASGLVMLSLVVFSILFSQIHAWLYVVASCALMGTVAAFFLFNLWGRVDKGTKIFMGDSGSLILGYAMAYLSIKYAMNNDMVLPDTRSGNIVWPFTILLIPVFDLVRVAFGRILKGRSFFHADKTHLHHKLMNLMTMRQTLCAILGLFVVFCLINTFLLSIALNATFILLLDILLFTAFIEAINLIIRHKKKHKL